jgi:hypothetical protein
LSESPGALEQQRNAILSQIVEPGDFRSGSITVISGRCSKPECHCHQPNQHGHGPNFRLTRKVKGKLVKAQREVEAFHRFRELSQELLEVNEKICRSRPVEDPLTPWKRNGGNGPAAHCCD